MSVTVPSWNTFSHVVIYSCLLDLHDEIRDQRIDIRRKIMLETICANEAGFTCSDQISTIATTPHPTKSDSESARDDEQIRSSTPPIPGMSAPISGDR